MKNLEFLNNLYKTGQNLIYFLFSVNFTLFLFICYLQNTHEASEILTRAHIGSLLVVSNLLVLSFVKFIHYSKLVEFLMKSDFIEIVDTIEYNRGVETVLTLSSMFFMLFCLTFLTAYFCN